ncbi:MAG: fumarylacetoacetate hydrolase family protein, partial [Phaeodactylibacter sp.]|nr:fumarylacetoacetate hydrolase family protein [Phaeodactylibacter sp.]
MKLIRFGEAGQERPGVELPDGKRLDVSGFGEDYTEAFLASNGIERLGRWLSENQPTLPVVDSSVRLGVPVARPGKIVCIGLNYRLHAEESGMKIPGEPVIFFKATSSLSGPFDPVVLPKGSTKSDWEVELAVVIGKKASYVSEAAAMDYVAGYALHNDLSERAFQLEREGQWVKGKSCDTFAPLGPYLVTKDEIKDPHQLNLKLWLNGKLMQDGNTNDFIFNIPFAISYLSQFMSL